MFGEVIISLHSHKRNRDTHQVVYSIPIRLFLIPNTYHNLCNKNNGMYYHIKEPQRQRDRTSDEANE